MPVKPTNEPQPPLNVFLILFRRKTFLEAKQNTEISAYFSLDRAQKILAQPCTVQI